MKFSYYFKPLLDCSPIDPAYSCEQLIRNVIDSMINFQTEIVYVDVMQNHQFV